MKKRSLILLLIIFTLVCIVPQSEIVTADTEWDDEISFDDEAEVREKFAFYFVSDQNARRFDDFDFSWELKEGAICRVNNIDPSKDTVNIAIMTYKKDVFDDFELSVDFKAGAKTSFWPVVGIRQQIPGKYYTTPGGGAGIFMQQNGKLTFWGPIISGSLIEREIAGFQNYYPIMWHNLRIRAVGTKITVFVDGVEQMTVSVNSTDYTKGYISLQSVNNDCRFDNFKIRSLSKSGGAKNEVNRYHRADDGIDLESLFK